MATCFVEEKGTGRRRKTEVTHGNEIARAAGGPVRTRVQWRDGRVV
jgi:hypothetical protein